jgi:hypothetical protein
MSERPKYIGNSSGGVPEAIFDPSISDRFFVGLAGTPLLRILSPTMININVIEQHNRIAFIGNYQPNGTVNFNIQTRDPETLAYKDPDVHAAKLVKRFIQYIEEQGKEVKCMYGDWNRTSINYKQFKGYLDALTHDMRDQDIIEAANSTWYGQLAHSLGFGKARILNDWRREYAVKVNFKKGYPIPFENL